MTTLQVVCGEVNGPIPDTKIYQSDMLRNCILHLVIVNNVPEMGLGPNPDYTHDVLKGKVERNNKWFAGDKGVFFISPCNCN